MVITSQVKYPLLGKSKNRGDHDHDPTDNGANPSDDQPNHHWCDSIFWIGKSLLAITKY